MSKGSCCVESAVSRELVRNRREEAVSSAEDREAGCRAAPPPAQTPDAPLSLRIPEQDQQHHLPLEPPAPHLSARPCPTCPTAQGLCSSPPRPGPAAPPREGTANSLSLSFLKDFIYLFLEKGREGEREGEKHQCVVASHVPPTGDLACNPGMCPDWEWNW